MINEYENTLRRLIFQVIGSNDNSEYKVTPERIEKWKGKREEETKKYKGSISETRLLYYSDFYDLGTIIDKNWELFKPILQDRTRFLTFFKEVSAYRNTLQHGRDLFTSHERLLEGILLDLKSLITIYYNKNKMKEDYFIRIIQVSDNLGNVWNPILRGSQPVLREGDYYEIIVEANDPKGRPIEYEVFRIGGAYKVTQQLNRFRINLDNNLIGRQTELYIMARTPETTYKNQDLLVITITVLPKV
jgi:hypothetical protein